MIELSEMIRELRRELTSAMADGEGRALRFEAGPVEVEAAVEVGREGGGSGRVRFWVVEAGAEGRLTRAATQRITVTLQPVRTDEDGRPAGPALIAGDEADGER
ncbi:MULTISPECIES: trypco2 family protein [Streptomyces]|uniref:Trypsin-co-occurring domain-containing protein n=2 Tax=Streptomyces TaxID=1883 RepID=A0A3R7F4M6_9ACTN|nr:MULTISPECIES: trypco2 family protein [Streptomyces]KNE82401.1 hypothetical protein ADZ36_11155 [Streptomyces fradiae]OFA52506.1 hypothetical protein BEN35_11260 [Streptomyces fradiae]PQM19662.1 hypothetical protein Sfr7A_30920 [Streptomyces xinghaiensis]RKM91043.1 hypothetical protein SFRA_030050 [Streptomyces xinghaiensis]RNC72367.1 hypothetical protein DC095_018405 [Streptomyces xinghaiensis]